MPRRPECQWDNGTDQHQSSRNVEGEIVGAGQIDRACQEQRGTYARRNVSERCVNRLKQWRGVATRYEKRAANYRATVTVVALLIWVTS